jgi:hypothetical protein
MTGSYSSFVVTDWLEKFIASVQLWSNFMVRLFKGLKPKDRGAVSAAQNRVSL